MQVRICKFYESEGICMEIMTIVGRKHVDFTDDKGKHIAGWSLFYTMKDDRTEGLMTGRHFITDEKAANITIPSPGDECEVLYDRYGRVSRITVVK